jgi:hypothetical protein
MVENRNHSSIWNTVHSITEVVPQCAPIPIDFYRHIVTIIVTISVGVENVIIDYDWSVVIH